MMNYMKRIRAAILTGTLMFGTILPLSATQSANTVNGIAVINDNPINGSIIGKVFDEDGTPLPGAGVTIKGTTIGVSTDLNGQFQLFPPNSNKNVTLLISYVGMKPKEVQVKGNSPIQVTLEWDTNMLDEVVATGFQTISRERSTGSAVIVNKEKLDKIQATSLTDKLEGMSAGLSTYGSAMSIRGTSSFATGTTPLLVVDGQVVIQDLGSINPDDIENITVLKDAASTSLYGVRASNGVIVVTTKKAKGEKPIINISAGFYLTPKPSLDYMHYASTSDIIDYEREYLLTDDVYKNSPNEYFSLKNDYTGTGFGALSQVERLYYDLSQGNITEAQLENKLNTLRNNDYRKEFRDKLQRLAFKQDYNISVAKGGDKSSLFFSARYEGDKNHNISSSDDKLSLYFKNELNFTKWFKFTYGANINYSTWESSQTGDGSLVYGMNTFLPYERIYDDNGNYVYQYPYNYYRSQLLAETDGLKSMGYNAKEGYDQNIQKTDDLYLRLFTHADFNIAKGLDLGIKFQYEDTRRDQEQYDEADSYRMRKMINEFASDDGQGGFIYNIPDGGHIFEDRRHYNYLNLRAQLNYQTTIADKHNIAVLVGGEIRQDKTRFNQNERYGYDDQKLTASQVDWATLSKDGVQGQLYQSKRDKQEVLKVEDMKHRYVSGYANAGYTYDGRYSLNGSVRVEQADLFGTDPKYRYRPLWSVGASWNVTNEEFMKNIHWLDMMKVRMTYGITGNVDQNSSPYLIGDYGTSQYTGASYTKINTPPNKMLRWEKTSTFNFGLDFGLFQRANATIDIYRRYSSDLLANKTLDPSTGFKTAKVNNGAMKNVGVEMSLSYDWIKKGDWALNTTLTATYNKNKVDKVGYTPSSAEEMLTDPYNNYLEGDTYGAIYAYQYAGLTEDGHPSVYDENGEIRSNVSVDNIKALVYKGQLTPKWQGALNIDLRWKSLELFAKFVYYTGHSLRNDVTPLYREVYRNGTAIGGINEDIVNRWTENNTDTDIPAMGLHGGYETFRSLQWKYADTHVMSASFIKLRNIGVSYSLPRKLSRQCGFNNISVRAQINNPCYWAANSEGIDPERFDANKGTRTQSQLTSYVLGLNINF